MQQSNGNWDYLPSYFRLLAAVMLPTVLLTVINLFLLPTSLFPVIGLSLFLLFVFAFKVLQQSYLIYYGAKNRFASNITHLNRPLSAWLAPFGEHLQSLGFRRLGEYEVQLPMNVTGTEWYFISADGIVLAELVDIVDFVEAFAPSRPQPMTNEQGELMLPKEFQALVAQFTTHFKEGQAVVETLFPMGHTVDKPNFRMSGIATSLDAAYRYHLRQVAELESVHGEPDIIETFTDYEMLVKVYRQVHIETKLGLPTWDNAISVASLILMFAAIALVLSSGLFWTVTSPWVYALNFVTMFGSMLPIIIIARRTRGADINKLKKKEATA